MSMINNFRINADVPIVTQGTATKIETFIHVEWARLILPVGTTVLGCVFLVTSIAESRQAKVAIWKSSALAALFHGLDVETTASWENWFNERDEAEC